MNRLLYNTAIINKLQEVVREHPYLRFGQILVDCGVIQQTYEDNWGTITIDPFNEESQVTWERMKHNKICFKDECTGRT